MTPRLSYALVKTPPVYNIALVWRHDVTFNRLLAVSCVQPADQLLQTKYQYLELINWLIDRHMRVALAVAVLA